MKKRDTLLEIKSLEHRMNHPMTLDEADSFNADLFKKNFSSQETNSENYQFEIDELMEYCLLTPKYTGLPMECYADDGGSWKTRNHPLWFLMKNGYGNTHDVIPFTVDANPKVVGEYGLKINHNDVNKVINFILRNKEGLIALGNGNIRNIDFIKNIDTFQYRMAESVRRSRLDEMAKLTSSETGLPTDIWVDEDQLYLEGGHYQRMKFNAIQGNHSTHNYTTITIKDNPPLIKKETLPKKTFLKGKDFKEIEKFVINNRELLLLLGDKKIDLVEFLSKMIPNK